MKTTRLFIPALLVMAALLMAPLWPFDKAEDPEPKQPDSPAPAKTTSLGVTEKDIFFTEPYFYLEPSVKDLVGMCLDLDYAFIRFPYGFVNTVDAKEPPIDYKKRMVIQEAAQLDRITAESGFKVGDPVTVLSRAGKASTATIKSFSYVGNSPSTVVVMADLKFDDGADPMVFKAHGLALRGTFTLPSTSIKPQAPLSPDDATAKKLVPLCAADLPQGVTLENKTVVPAMLDAAQPTSYFVSYWEYPPGEFEIDDVTLHTCLFQPRGDGWAKSAPPFPLELIQVYDLNGDDKAELFATTGSALEVCHVLMAPERDGYRIVKKGLCAGY